MNQHLLLHLSQSYKRIKDRGAVWVRSWKGGWYSEYKGSAGDKFLSRFDESVQKKIKLLAGAAPDPMTIPASAVVSILYPKI